MEGLFGYLTSPFTSVAQTFAQIEDDLEEQEYTEERHVTISTTTDFAKFDLWNAGSHWEMSKEGKVPIQVQKDARDGIEIIKEKFLAVEKLRSNKEAIEKAWIVSKAIEDLAGRLDKPEDTIQPDVEAGVDLYESDFDSRDLVNEGIRKYVRILFITLVRQLGCCEEYHLARLKLTGFFDVESRSFFDLYLSTRRDWPPCFWQETRCTITSCLEHRIRTSNCQLLIKRERKKLNLLLEEKLENEAQEGLLGMIQADDCKTIQNQAASPTISLWDLLKPGGRSNKRRSVRNADAFLPRVRDALCLNLALSLLQLCNDEWRCVRWCTGQETSIFFLEDPGNHTVLDKTRPYLSWRLQRDRKKEEDDPDLPCDPQLLDFAQLLVEIHRWERLPFEIESQRAESKYAFHSALSGFTNKYFRAHDLDFVKAVTACLSLAGKSSRNQPDPTAFQDYIYEEIVAHLERYKKKSPEPLEIFSAIPSSPYSIDSEQAEAKSNSMSLYDGLDYHEPQDKNSQADNFFSLMTKFTDEHIKVLKFQNSASEKKLLINRKIRIAILDSGIRIDDPSISGARRAKIIQNKNCRNFSSSDQKDWHDNVNHGTRVTRLLLKIAPEAELFIAKVSDELTIPKNKLHHIAEAINWAVQQCEVDIITISIALSEVNQDIDEALDQALDPEYKNATAKIIFAAAGNKGGNKPLAWPASKNGVIAIHATDWHGTPANLNPSSDEIEVSFATLGQDIRMNWPSSSGPDAGIWKDIYLSGTSYATPIAAGIAANVLEFARYRLDLNQRRKDRLFSHDGMRKIFKAMSTRKGEYHYVQPWTFWNKALEGDWGNRKHLELSRDAPENRENICRVLEFIVGKS